MRFRPEQHLRRQSEFRAVREQGRRVYTGPLALACFRPDPAAAGAPRLGVVASYANVGNAVQRNRAKRRLREVFRQHQQLVPPGADVILTARRTIAATSHADLQRAFAEACRLVASPKKS